MALEQTEDRKTRNSSHSHRIMPAQATRDQQQQRLTVAWLRLRPLPHLPIFIRDLSFGVVWRLEWQSRCYRIVNLYILLPSSPERRDLSER